jgi:adenylate cyclase
VFGLPEPSPDDAARALGAALALAGAVARWLSGLAPETGDRLGVRLGAHCGEVVVSRLGGETHQHITATGDCVNVASRLLEVAAAHGATIAASAALFERARARRPLPAGAFGGEREVAIRGRARPLSVRLCHGARPTNGEGAPETAPFQRAALA